MLQSHLFSAPERKLLLGLGMLTVLLCALPACFAEPNELRRIYPETFSTADEVKIAERLFAGAWRDENIALLDPDADVFTDAAYDYLRPLMHELLAREEITRRDSFAWAIHLVLDNSIHAYTLPGGQLVLHTGLLHALDHEAACMGILAREIALAETGAAMAAYDRAVEDNLSLGDLILGNPTSALRDLIRLAPTVTYTEAELARADSLAARLVCGLDRWPAALPAAVSRFDESTKYRLARIAHSNWQQTFNSRVSSCEGPDSLYTERYQSVLRWAVPR